MEKHRPEDNLFKKILENHPDFEPSKSIVNDMKNRLDTADKFSQKNGFKFWWLSLLLLPFIFATGFIFFQNQKLNQKLNYQVQELNSKLLTIQKDTLQQKYVTYYFDTIYNTTYINQTIERNPTKYDQNQPASILSYPSDNSRTFAFQSSMDYFNLENKNLRKKPFVYKGSNTFTTLQLYNFAQEKRHNTSRENRPKDRFENPIIASQKVPFISPLLSYLEKNKYANVLLENINPAFEFKKHRRNPMQYFTPKGFRIGISGSPYSLTKSHSQIFRPTYSYGIEGEIDFNKNVRLLLGLRKMDMTFEEQDPLKTALYPSITPTDPTDEIEELYVSLSQIQIPISFKYLFNPDKKWQPFLSFGIVANRPFQQKFNYNFVSTSSDDYEIKRNFYEGAFSIKNLQGSFGIETTLLSKLSATAEIYYLHDFELGAGEYFLSRNAGLNIGLKYKF